MKYISRLFVLTIYSSRLNVFLKFILRLSSVLITYIWNMEWAVVAPLMVLAFYVFRDKTIWRFIVYEMLMLGYAVFSMGGLTAMLQNVDFLLVVQIPILAISFLYNGKKGRFPRFSKYFFLYVLSSAFIADIWNKGSREINEKGKACFLWYHWDYGG